MEPEPKLEPVLEANGGSREDSPKLAAGSRAADAVLGRTSIPCWCIAFNVAETMVVRYFLCKNKTILFTEIFSM